MVADHFPTELEEAIVIIRSLYNDTIRKIERAQYLVKSATESDADHLNRAAKGILPNFNQGIYDALLITSKEFAELPTIVEAFNKHRPRLLRFKSKFYDEDLDMARTQFKAWASEQRIGYNTRAEYIDQLDQLNARLRELAKVQTLLEILQESKGKLTSELKAIIDRLANFSNNYSRSKRDEYAMMNGIYFEEDWSGLADLVTELLYAVEVFELADNTQLNWDAVQEFDQPISTYNQDINQGANAPDPTGRDFSQPVYPENDGIKTDDSLGYYS